MFGPLLTMGGHIAVRAVHASDLGLLTLIGAYLGVIGVLGVTALPKSPFWAALLLAPALIAGGLGWLA